MDKKTKTYLIVGLVALLLIIGVALFFYFKGKKTTTQAPLLIDNPDGQPTGQGNNVYGVSAGEISRISDALHNDMAGFNLFGHDVQPYQDLIALSDTDFGKVYNDFNTKYQPNSGSTLTGWINSESFAFNDVADSIRQRLGRLNLK